MLLTKLLTVFVIYFLGISSADNGKSPHLEHRIVSKWSVSQSIELPEKPSTEIRVKKFASEQPASNNNPPGKLTLGFEQ